MRLQPDVYMRVATVLIVITGLCHTQIWADKVLKDCLSVYMPYRWNLQQYCV